MRLDEKEKVENLRFLLEQHWIHCRHLESERAWFMSAYGAVVGGILAFSTYTGLKDPWLYYFLIVLTLFGFFHTIRWIYAFECHRTRVNELAEIIWSMTELKTLIDPTMRIPPTYVVPRSIKGKKTPQWFHEIDELFRTRYWFPLFYFVILVGCAIFFFIIQPSASGQGIALAALILALLLGLSWYFSLKRAK